MPRWFFMPITVAERSSVDGQPKCWVKVHNFSHSKNKFGYIYMLTPQGIAEKTLLAGRFLKRKLTEYDQLQAEIEALKAEMACSDIDG